MLGVIHGWRLLGDARRLARHGALRPFERHADAPASVRLLCRALRLFANAPTVPDYAAGLQSCGPAAIKLGQALATRPDLVGERVAADLAQLQDDLPPAPWPEVERELDLALPGGWRAHFRHIEPIPVGAASIAQVHRAERADGGKIALKILRPGVEEKFQAAIASYAWAAAHLERLGGEFARLKPRVVIETFRHWTMAELDLRREAGNASELRDALRSSPEIAVPAILWEATTRRTLAMEWMEGVKLTDRAAVERLAVDRPALAAHIVRAFLHQAIGQGFFHADLHQGNLLLTADGRLVLVDFGIMGRLDRRARVYLAEILHGLIVGNYRRVAEIHFEAGYVPPHHDIAAFATALRAVGEPIRGRHARDISIANLLDGLFAVTREFDMAVQPHLLLLQKTMVMVEGVALGLDPEVNMWEIARPYVAGWMRDELGPEARLADSLLGTASLIGRLPGLAQRFLRQLPPESAAPPPPPLPPLPASRSNRLLWFVFGLLLGALLSLAF